MSYKLRISTDPANVRPIHPSQSDYGGAQAGQGQSNLPRSVSTQPNLDSLTETSPSGSSEDELIKATTAPSKLPPIIAPSLPGTGPAVGTGRSVLPDRELGHISQSPSGPVDDGSPVKPKSFHGSQTSTSSRVSQASGATKKSKQEDPDDPTPQKLGKGYASMQTVLTVAALLCVGFMLTCSGIIILATQRHNYTFRITGIVFLAVGLASIVLCAILQWKNVKKNVDRLEKQLFAI